MAVSDSGSPVQGFKDGHTTGNDYLYDINGNMIEDKNKAISEIRYNHLNLPTYIEKDHNVEGHIEYVYDATGTKLQKRVDDRIANTTGTTSYAGNYIYEYTTLKVFFNPEGYVEPSFQTERDGSQTLIGTVM